MLERRGEERRGSTVSARKALDTLTPARDKSIEQNPTNASTEEITHGAYVSEATRQQCKKMSVYYLESSTEYMYDYNIYSPADLALERLG